MKSEFNDLGVSIELPYTQARLLEDFIVAYGQDSDDEILRAIRRAIEEVEKSRARQDSSLSL